MYGSWKTILGSELTTVTTLATGLQHGLHSDEQSLEDEEVAQSVLQILTGSIGSNGGTGRQAELDDDEEQAGAGQQRSAGITTREHLKILLSKKKSAGDGM